MQFQLEREKEGGEERNEMRNEISNSNENYGFKIYTDDPNEENDNNDEIATQQQHSVPSSINFNNLRIIFIQIDNVINLQCIGDTK